MKLITQETNFIVTYGLEMSTATELGAPTTGEPGTITGAGAKRSIGSEGMMIVVSNGAGNVLITPAFAAANATMTTKAMH